MEIDEAQAAKSREQQLRDHFRSLRQAKAEQELAIEAAEEAIKRLVMVCANKTGQSFHLRALLFSLWNGKKAELLNVVNLDWALRKDLCAVILAFGCEPFFYDAVRDAFDRKGLLEWFIAQADAE